MSAEYWLTLFGTVILHGSSVPQYIRSFRRKRTEDISLILWGMIYVGYMLLMAVAVLQRNASFMIVYGVGLANVGGLMGQTIYYRYRPGVGSPVLDGSSDERVVGKYYRPFDPDSAEYLQAYEDMGEVPEEVEGGSDRQTEEES